MGHDPGRAVRRWGGARLRIGAAFSALAILLFGGVGFLSAHDARQQAERDTSAALQQLADRLAQRLDADMAARFRDIGQLAQLHDLMNLDPDAAEWRRVLEGLRQSSTHYSWIGVTTADGKVRSATGGLLETVDVRSRPWFANGQHRTHVTDVHEAKLLASLLPTATPGEPLRFVDISAPLRLRGKTVGVVGAHVSWAWAEERRRQALAGQTTQAGVDIVLVNREGSIELGPPTPALTPTLAPTPEPAARDAVAALMRAPALLRWSDGQRYLSAASASKPMSDYPGMGWTVVVRQPEALAMAAAVALEQRLLWLSVVGAALFGALGWWLADRLTRPLRLVAAQAHGLRPGAEDHTPHDEVGQLASTLSTLLADLQQREAELTSANDLLESRVATRTASVHQANEDLRAFSRSLSHDIQGPLGAMAQLLRHTLQDDTQTLPENAAHVVRVVVGECERLKRLSAELLTLAMVDQGEMACSSVDHAALAQEVIDQLRVLAPEGFPQVGLGPLPALPGDPVMMRQVWTNLLSNAVKFSAKVDAPHISVNAVTLSDETVFTVADNGVGFDEAQRGRLFGVFQRLHAQDQYRGTGVGLSIVRRVVQRHGGRVWAESPARQGARFHFALPNAPAAARQSRHEP